MRCLELLHGGLVVGVGGFAELAHAVAPVEHERRRLAAQPGELHSGIAVRGDGLDDSAAAARTESRPLSDAFVAPGLARKPPGLREERRVATKPASPRTISAHGQSPRTRRTIATTTPRTISRSRTDEGGTPKKRRSATWGSTGAGAGSGGGTSATTVSPDATGAPHSGRTCCSTATRAAVLTLSLGHSRAPLSTRFSARAPATLPLPAGAAGRRAPGSRRRRSCRSGGRTRAP